MREGKGAIEMGERTVAQRCMAQRFVWVGNDSFRSFLGRLAVFLPLICLHFRRGWVAEVVGRRGSGVLDERVCVRLASKGVEDGIEGVDGVLARVSNR